MGFGRVSYPLGPIGKSLFRWVDRNFFVVSHGVGPVRSKPQSVHGFWGGAMSRFRGHHVVACAGGLPHADGGAQQAARQGGLDSLVRGEAHHSSADRSVLESAAINSTAEIALPPASHKGSFSA